LIDLTSSLNGTKPIYIEVEYKRIRVLNVRTLCLGYLSLGDATGYDMKKDFEEGLFCHFMEASYGSIYPALSQLAAEGLVTVREEEQSGKPDKKVYSIAPSGVATLSKALNVLPQPDKFKSEFLFIMLLQTHISAEHRIAAMEKQLADVKMDLHSLNECKAGCVDDPAGQFVMGYGHAVLTASVTYLEEHLAIALSKTNKLAAE
jgi:PadR family transcriptional regulator, regulatory protein AphA